MKSSAFFLASLLALTLAACQPTQQAAPSASSSSAPSAPASEPAPAASAPPAKAQVADGPVQHFKANGFSPAWMAEVQGDKLSFEVPETTGPDTKPRTITVTRTASAKGVEFEGMDGKVPVFLGIGNGPCTKATEGNQPREFKATFGYGVASYEGCADGLR